MKMFLTGSSGFIGRNITEKLLQDNYTVIAYGRKDAFPNSQNYTFVAGDITQYRKIFAGLGDCEYAVHLAASIPKKWSYKSDITNVNGTINLLEAARKRDLKKLILFSSSAVYGPSENPIDEDSSLLPKSFYGVDKLVCEMYAKQYNEEYGLPIVIFRPSNVYGKYQHPINANSNFIAESLHKVINGEKISIYNGGEIERDFVYAPDLYNPITTVLKREDIKWGIYNLGSGTCVKIREVVDLIEGIANKKAIIRDVSKEVSNKVCLDISKAKRELGFEPRYDLKRGIAETYEWIRNQRF